MGDAPTTAELMESVERFVAGYNDARNKHDAQLMASFYAADGDLIGANGSRVVGRSSIEGHLAREHTSVYRQSTAQRKLISVYSVDARVVIATGTFSVVGTRSLGDMAISQSPGIFTLVLRRGGLHEWEIVAYRSMVPQDVFADSGADDTGAPA